MPLWGFGNLDYRNFLFTDLASDLSRILLLFFRLQVYGLLVFLPDQCRKPLGILSDCFKVLPELVGLLLEAVDVALAHGYSFAGHDDPLLDVVIDFQLLVQALAFIFTFLVARNISELVFCRGEQLELELLDLLFGLGLHFLLVIGGGGNGLVLVLLGLDLQDELLDFQELRDLSALLGAIDIL